VETNGATQAATIIARVLSARGAVR